MSFLIPLIGLVAVAMLIYYVYILMKGEAR